MDLSSPDGILVCTEAAQALMRCMDAKISPGELFCITGRFKSHFLLRFSMAESWQKWCRYPAGALYSWQEWCRYPGGAVYSWQEWCRYPAGALYSWQEWCRYPAGVVYSWQKWCRYPAGALYSWQEWFRYPAGLLFSGQDWCRYPAGVLYSWQEWCKNWPTVKLFFTLLFTTFSVLLGPLISYLGYLVNPLG